MTRTFTASSQLSFPASRACAAREGNPSGDAPVDAFDNWIPFPSHGFRHARPGMTFVPLGGEAMNTFISPPTPDPSPRRGRGMLLHTSPNAGRSRAHSRERVGGS